MKRSVLFFIATMLYAMPYAEQINIPRIETMPNIPPNYIMRNWKKVTLDYDNLVYNLNASGTHLPLTKINDGNGVNYPEIKNLRMDTYVGSNYHGDQAEAINILPSIVGASLNGIDKTTQDGNNYVAKTKDYFNRANGQNVYLNGYSAGTGGDWWYEIMPNVFFYQMRYLYPNADPDFTSQMKIIAGRQLGVVLHLGGNIKSWTFPNMNYRAYNLLTNTPNATSVPEPEAAGSIAWLLYQAYLATDSIPYRQGAELALGFLNNWQSNPSYEIQLPYGIITAARMNAVEGTNYNIDKFLNWTFSPGNGTLRGWGTITGNWNGYEMSGLIGEAKDNNNDYAFVMNGFQHAAALAPLPKYDKRYARAIAKWLLNLATASRFFYPNFLPAANNESVSLAWSNEYDTNSSIPYESIKENWQGTRPLAMGDALRGNWAATNLSLYSGSSVGYLAAIIDTTNVEGILQINMNKTDFSPLMTQQYPSYLYYNPHNTAKTVTITLPEGTYDIYDAIQETKIKTSVSGNTTISISPDNVMLLTLYPAGGIWKTKGRILMVENGGILDYHYGYNYQNPLRIISLFAENTTVQIGDSILFTCRTENGNNINYSWYANGTLAGSTTSNTFYYKPQTEG
ncbi:MAG: immunoglobulin domain-containing protein, partial [Bacteroidales bacterium]|nr:immunoglobulin domain-containing protein [Bacteroidales bacterium]